MKFNFLTIAFAGILWMGDPVHVFASPKKAATSPSPTPALPAVTLMERPVPFNGKIFGLDEAAKIFTTQNKEKKLRFYAFTPETKVIKNNESVSWKSLKVGDEVRGTAIPRGEGHFDVIDIKIGMREDLTKGAPTAAPAGKKTK